MAWAAAADKCGARGALSVHTLLFDLPPALLGELCAVLDSCDGALGWRGLGKFGPRRRAHPGGGRGASARRSVLWASCAAGQLCAVLDSGERAPRRLGGAASWGSHPDTLPFLVLERLQNSLRASQGLPLFFQRNFDFRCKMK